jgi:hypothetical protein
MAGFAGFGGLGLGRQAPSWASAGAGQASDGRTRDMIKRPTTIRDRTAAARILSLFLSKLTLKWMRDIVRSQSYEKILAEKGVVNIGYGPLFDSICGVHGDCAYIIYQDDLKHFCA